MKNRQIGFYKKIIRFCALKDTISRVKTQPTEWEEIFANHVCDKRLISRPYREFSKLDKKIN